MELTLQHDDQDRIIHLCLIRSDFLGQILRKRIESRHFASEVRQKIFKTITDFYKDYKRSPEADIVHEIDSRIRRKRIKEEDKELYEEYLVKVLSIPDFSIQALIDRLDFFVKTRIVTNLSNDLLKLQDRFDIDPDKPLQKIRDAVTEANSVIGRRGAESILFDPLENLKRVDIVTRFGISPIDDQLMGGLKPQNYVVIQGFTGLGKSWCINHLAKMAVRYGNSPLVIPTEMSNQTARIRFRMSFTGLSSTEVLNRPEVVKEKTAESMLHGADIFLLSEEEKGIRVDEIPAVVEDTEARTGKQIPLILIDSPDDMMPPEGRYKNSLEANTAIHTFLKNYAKNEDKCIVSTAQVRRGEGEKKYWLGPSTVGDNINKIRKATVAISINGLEDEKKRWFFRMWLFKNTDGMEGARIWAKRDFARGQFITKYSAWEQFSYKSMIEKEPILDKPSKPKVVV